MMAKARIDAVLRLVPDEKTKADVASYLESEGHQWTYLRSGKISRCLKNRDIIYLDNAATSQKPACCPGCGKAVL